MKYFIFTIFIFSFLMGSGQNWNSKWVSIGDNGKLVYHADDEGNIIPDFSRVGYREGQQPPEIVATIELSPQEGDDFNRIQEAVNTLAEMTPNADGIRGCLLLKEGVFEVEKQITISSSGIIIKGAGNGEDGTVVVATGTKQYTLFKIEGDGALFEIPGSNVKIDMDFVPVGTKKIAVRNVGIFNEGENIVVYRPGTSAWISDLKMDQIEERDDGGEIVQWEASSYNLRYQRKIEKITGDTLVLDNPIVMQMEEQYGGGYVYKYGWQGRINECGIENMLLKSVYNSETDEEHAWNAIRIERAKDCWVQNITAKHFGYSAVNIASTATNVSVLNCKCIEPKSLITGSRRYSFNCDGQLNLFKNCEATEGRHDFITGARVCGPNVFTNCRASNTHADIGPHHRWTTGTLYDKIKTDGQINVQDRGNYGTGHGWAGATQILWNCIADKISVQNPWVSSKNYAIGCFGSKSSGRFNNRPDGEWEGFNFINLEPTSLYEAQLADRLSIATSANSKQLQKDNLFTVTKVGKVLALRFLGQNSSGTMEIFDIYGKQIANFSIPRNKTSMQIPIEGKGLFIIRMSDKQKIQTQKVIL